MANISSLTMNASLNSFGKRTMEATVPSNVTSVSQIGVSILCKEVKKIYNFSNHLRALKKDIVVHEQATCAQLQNLIEKITELDAGIIESHPNTWTKNNRPDLSAIFINGLKDFSEQMKKTRELLRRANEDFSFCSKILKKINILNSEKGSSFVWMENFISKYLEEIDLLEEMNPKKKIACAAPQKSLSDEQNLKPTLSLSPEQILESLATPTIVTNFQLPSVEQNKICPLLTLSPAISYDTSEQILKCLEITTESGAVIPEPNALSPPLPTSDPTILISSNCFFYVDQSL